MPRIPTRATAIVTAAACVLLAVWLWHSDRAERTLQRANDAGLAGRYALAAREAARAETGGVTDSRAHATRAYALAALRRFPQSAAEFRRALKGDPQNWVLRRDLARVLLAIGQRHSARAEMSLARALNPRMTLPRGFVAPRKQGVR